MAAGVIEACLHLDMLTYRAHQLLQALELGADTLLFDEDTCATNFLIRDRRMQKLVKADPITPLVYKVRQTFQSVAVSSGSLGLYCVQVRAMYKDLGCSSILVIGGCGEFCDGCAHWAYPEVLWQVTTAMSRTSY